MEYKVLSADLRVKGKTKLPEAFEYWREYDHFVPDDYDDEDSVGLEYAGPYGAFSHACRMIEALDQKSTRRNWVDVEARLVRDAENYFEDPYIWMEENQEETIYLMRAMVSLGLEQDLYLILKACFEDYEREWKESKREGMKFSLDCSTDYRVWFIAFGDQLLFEDERPKDALKFYELANSRWMKPDENLKEDERWGTFERGDDAEDYENDDEDDEEKEMFFRNLQKILDVKEDMVFSENEEWEQLKEEMHRKNFEKMDWILPDGTVVEDVSGDLDQWSRHERLYRYYYEMRFGLLWTDGKNRTTRALERFYDQTKGMLRRDEGEESVLMKTDEFYTELENVIFSNLTNHELRIALMMAHAIRERVLLMAVNDLGKKEEELQWRYRDVVIRRLQYSDLKDLGAIQEYMSRYFGRARGGKPFYATLLRLMQTLYGTRKIRERLRVKNMKQDVAYYTSLQTLSYLLPGQDKKNPNQGKLSIMHMAYMNDPNEGKTLRRYLFPGAHNFDRAPSKRRDVRYPYVFMKCFTPLVDDLPMWEMYGDSAKGCCIVLNKGQFLSAGGGKAEIPLYRICYLRKDGEGARIEKDDNPGIADVKEIESYLNQIRDWVKKEEVSKRVWYLKIVEEMAYLFKDADYHHEQEVRLYYHFYGHQPIFRYTPGEYPLLYIQKDFYPLIREVILGPKFEDRFRKMPYLQEQMEMLSEKIGMEMPMITVSDIEYR